MNKNLSPPLLVGLIALFTGETLAPLHNLTHGLALIGLGILATSLSIKSIISNAPHCPSCAQPLLY